MLEKWIKKGLNIVPIFIHLESRQKMDRYWTKNGLFCWSFRGHMLILDKENGQKMHKKQQIDNRQKMDRKWTRKWTENGQNIDRDGSKDGQKMDLDKVEKEHAIG